MTNGVMRKAAGFLAVLLLSFSAFADSPAGAPAVPERLPDLLKAIAAELDMLWDVVQDMPALKEALAKPMGLAKEALTSLKGMGEPSEEALKELVVLSLSLHRIEDVFERGIGERIRERLQSRDHVDDFRGMGPRGLTPERPGGQGLATGRFGEVRDWIEAYLKGAMSALSPEEAAKFRGIVQGLIQGLREEFAPERPARERPTPEALELGKHVLRIKALSAKLDLFLIRALKAVEAPPAE